MQHSPLLGIRERAVVFDVPLDGSGFPRERLALDRGGVMPGGVGCCDDTPGSSFRHGKPVSHVLREAVAWRTGFVGSSEVDPVLTWR